MAACTATEQLQEEKLAPLLLPDVTAAGLSGEKLRVVTTTSIIGDVVDQVGGGAIDLTVLMDQGQDPHGFEPSARDLTKASEAHVIFVNGWNLEEGLVIDLENVSDSAPIVPVSAGITPLAFGQNGPVADPHTWLDPENVLTWVANIEQILSQLDPVDAADFATNAESYRERLKVLIAYYDEQVMPIPVDRRKLVTNHDSLGYFAQDYNFEIVGTVLPAASTLAEPSARDLATLLEMMTNAGVCTIFAETTANERLAKAAADELNGCDSVEVIALSTGALGPAGSSTGDYLGLMRANIDAIVDGLQ